MISTHVLPDMRPEQQILLAEDHEASRHMLQLYLRGQGFGVISTDNGDEAWEVLSDPGAPRIALLDWTMPGMDGPEICRRVRSSRSDAYTYLVLLTSRSGKDEVAEGLAAGADDYVTKPYDREELVARIAVGQRVLSLESRLGDRVRELENALSEVRKLKRLLPICMFCKRVRDDSAYWRQIDEYIYSETGTDFSHSVCPECVHKFTE